MNRLMLANAETLRQLNERLHEAFRAQAHGPDHRAAAAAFHDQYDALAFPGGLKNELERLDRGDPEAVELAIQFLEADPRFHRSGYIKETMLRWLKRCDLNERQRSLLRRLVIRSIGSGGRREHQGYSRLASKITTPELILALQTLSTSTDAEESRRASNVLNAIHSSKTTTNLNT